MPENKKYHSLAKTLPLMISLSFLILFVVVVSVTYFRVEKRMIGEYRRMADGLTNLMIEELDTTKMDYYISENYSSPEYMCIMKRYYQLKANFPDVFYMYIYRFYKDENGKPCGTIIFDLEDEYTDTPNQVSIDWVGGLYEVLEPFASRIDEMLESSEPVYETAFSPEDGYLLSLAKPIFDENGNYIASACVDFSMEVLHRQNIRFIMILSFILVLVIIAVLLIFIFVLRNAVTYPMLSISVAVSGFRYDTECDLKSNLDSLRELDIDSKNEIEILYNALLTAEKDSLYYMSSYNKAENEIQTKDKKISELGNLALRDVMTSVGNKTAFTLKISEIKDTDEYGIVLMDVNNLKMINDTYGHEAGDSYIIGVCRVLCDVYSHSPVFRIGGDEFAVILKGRDYENRQLLIESLAQTFDVIWAQNENNPCYRFSGSFGMADSTVCKTTRETIRAADDAMYRCKKNFKEKYGSYR